MACGKCPSPGDGPFDIAQTRDNLAFNVIGSSSARFGYWFSGYFTAAGHCAY
jgi:hypothetical protein